MQASVNRRRCRAARARRVRMRAAPPHCGTTAPRQAAGAVATVIVNNDFGEPMARSMSVWVASHDQELLHIPTLAVSGPRGVVGVQVRLRMVSPLYEMKQ